VSGRKIRVGVAGVGEFGKNHARVWSAMEGVELAAIFDGNSDRASQIAAEYKTKPVRDLNALIAEGLDAVSIAVPTLEHANVGCRLLDAGVDLLVEKPMAASIEEADALIDAAKRNGRVLQIGHLERFNPAVIAAQRVVARPMFFEVHRLGIFSPRSLDVDVVYDLMIHDLDILSALVDTPVVDLKAVGIPVITDKVDIAHARVEFATGAVANVTASRVSTERVRKMRFFQAHEYISLDFTRQDALRIRVENGMPQFEKLSATPGEPLKAELEEFAECVRTRKNPIVDGPAGRRALELADQVMAGILEHGKRVQAATFANPLIP
jgi:predicted dehydrogenase